MTGKFKRVLVVAAAIAALAVGGAAIASATGGDDDDDGTEQAISGAALDKASAAALEQTGGGRVTETEVGDEEGYYEVEVTRDDGSQVDVHLDRDFNVTSEAADDDRGGEENEANDD